MIYEHLILPEKSLLCLFLSLIYEAIFKRADFFFVGGGGGVGTILGLFEKENPKPKKKKKGWEYSNVVSSYSIPYYGT